MTGSVDNCSTSEASYGTVDKEEIDTVEGRLSLTANAAVTLPVAIAGLGE